MARWMCHLSPAEPDWEVVVGGAGVLATVVPSPVLFDVSWKQNNAGQMEMFCVPLFLGGMLEPNWETATAERSTSCITLYRQAHRCCCSSSWFISSVRPEHCLKFYLVAVTSVSRLPPPQSENAPCTLVSMTHVKPNWERVSTESDCITLHRCCFCISPSRLSSCWEVRRAKAGVVCLPI